METAKRSREKERVSEKDPFYSVEDAGDKNRRLSIINQPDIISLNQEMDCPEGFSVSENVWAKLQELRTLKIIKVQAQAPA